MKKLILLVIVLFTSFSPYSFAEEDDTQQPDMQRPEIQQQDGPRGDGSGMMDEDRMRMKGGPKMGMHPTVVATSDGGIVVLMGKKIAKYNSELDLVKEVELKGGPKHADKNLEQKEILTRRHLTPPQNEPVNETLSEPAPTGLDIAGSDGQVAASASDLTQ